MRRRRRSMAQMNVVPYIDVILVLLVIFMVTAPMLQSGVDINLPDADAAALATDNQQEPLIINVDQSGQYFLQDGSTLSAADVTAYVRGEMDEAARRPVYVRADAVVENRYLMTLLVAVQKAGAKQIGLMADPLSAEGE